MVKTKKRYFSPLYFLFLLCLLLFGLVFTVPSSAVAVEGPYNYYLPYLSTVDSDWTGLALANGSKTSLASVIVTVYGESGNVLLSLARTLAVDGQTAFSMTPASATRGWILVNSHQPLTGLAFLGSGQTQSLMADIPFVSETATELVIPHIAQDGTWDTTALICNPQAQAVTVVLKHITPAGLVEREKSYTLPAHGSISCQLAATFATGTALAGRITLSATGGISAFALYSNTKSGGSYYAGINAAVDGAVRTGGLQESLFTTPTVIPAATAAAAETYARSSTFTSPLPDTGQTKCYDNDNEITCPAPGQPFYGQDAQYSRARSYTKLDINGNDLSVSATSWSMVRDNVTGLIWEVKENRDEVVDYSNSHDADNGYTWYDSNSATNGGDAGTPGSGTDTEDFINALNSANYGGHNDWRLPTIDELDLLVDTGRVDAAIDEDFFPATGWANDSNKYRRYWSSTTYASNSFYAWRVYLYNGNVYYDNKTYSYYVRAVRSGQ